VKGTADDSGGSGAWCPPGTRSGFEGGKPHPQSAGMHPRLHRDSGKGHSVSGGRSR